MTSTTPDLDQFINLAEIEAAAQAALAPMVRDYYAAGAMDEITLRDNREAFDRIAIRYHVLGGTSERNLSTQILGRKHDWPVLTAPTAFARLAHPDGEIGVARATAAAGVTQVLSTLSTTSLEDVARAVPDGARWFQLYVFRDRGLTADLVRRAEAAGYEAIVMTVDTPILGRRERDARNRFSLPEGLSAANLGAAMSRVASDGDDSGLFQFFARMMDPGLTWDDLEWLCSLTTLPVLVKGVVRGDDAERAITHGAAGVIVSNHGGRQLDTAISSIDALSDVAEAVDGRGAVLMDGGIRRGTDIVKALASGASAVLIGRPALWGLAVGGEAGVARVLAILRDEFDLAMALCGARNVEDLWPDLLV
jgi:4-hydroxymandelate oxidase